MSDLVSNLASDLPRIIVIGAGLVGARHARLIAESPSCHLAAIVDPSATAADLALALHCRHVDDVNALDAGDCDGAIVATPNHSHGAIGLACLAKGWPVLMEKPITDDVAAGEALVSAFEGAGLPLLVGHHRRYHPFVAATQKLLADGAIGAPVVLSAIWAVKKPDDYFQKGAWRLGADGGPIMINLIHEVDLLRAVFGEIVEVQAIASNHQRLGPVEDSAAIILRFASGLLGTVALSDCALTPWSFEGASGENPHIAESAQSSWRLGCTEGALEFPVLKIWRDAERGIGDWSKSLVGEAINVEPEVPLRAQLNHFIRLINGQDQEPHVTGREGLQSLIVTRAIMQSAREQRPVSIQTIFYSNDRQRNVS